MKKAVYVLLCLTLISLSILGCENTKKNTTNNISKEKTSDKIEETIEDVLGKKIKNTQKIRIMSHGSSIARLHSQESIKQLEDFFNEVKFYRIDNPGFSLHIDINFYGEYGEIQIRVYDDDHIRINDDIYLESNEITYEKIYSVFIDYVSRNRQGKY